MKIAAARRGVRAGHLDPQVRRHVEPVELRLALCVLALLEDLIAALPVTERAPFGDGEYSE